MIPTTAMVLIAHSVYQDTMTSWVPVRNAFLAAKVVMVAIVTTAITQHVLKVLRFATMQIATERGVLKMNSSSVQAVLTVSIRRTTIAIVVTICTVNVRMHLVVTNVFQGIMVQATFARSVFLENMVILVNKVV